MESEIVLLPQDMFAEGQLLGVCLKKPGLIGSLRLTPSDIYDGRHRRCWQAMQRLDRQGKPVNTDTLLDELPFDGPRDDYMALWEADWTAPADMAGLLVTRIAGLAERRRLIAAAQSIAEQAWDTRHQFDGGMARRILDRAAPAALESEVFDLP